jgi:transposase
VRCFSSFSDDLHALADWLDGLGIEQVAMEATGVYWIPLYEVLDRRGFEVHRVNSRATRQVTGRKSDVLDCQWIWQLMSHGLLHSAFRPADVVCVLRAFVRQRADAATVARSLHGNWRAEHMFALSQALAHYDFLEQQIHECDQAIHNALAALPVRAEAPNCTEPPSRSPHRSAAEQRELQQTLTLVMGVDLTAIPTLGVDTVLVLASEIGADLSRFPSQAHFCSWLGLAPPTRISGGKPLPGSSAKVFNHAGQALRQAASNARASSSFIGASHRARLARMDTSKAIKATAHQLARLIYAMLTKGQPYVEKGIEAFEARRQDRQLRALQRKAHRLGLTLVQAA